MTAGDNAKDASKYEDAIISYNAALGYKPNDQAAKDKIAECELKMQERDNTRLKDAQWVKYNELMKKADALFDGRDFAKAKMKYNEARGLEPSEQRPKDRIAQCDALLNGQQLVQKNPDLVAKPDDPTERKKRYEYLKKTYGMGVTEIAEVTEGNKKKLQRVVVTDSPDTTDVYTRIAYSYGQIFYYKNDVQITMEEFVQVTGPQ